MDRYLHAFSTTADRKSYLRTNYLEPFVSATTTESSGASHVAHYQKDAIAPTSDGRLWAYFNVEDISEPTAILFTTSGVKDLIIDGESVTPATTYQFSETGEHLLKIELTNPATITAGNSTTNLGLFGNVTALRRVEIPEEVTTIGAYSFANCNGLSELAIHGEKACYVGIRAFLSDASLTKVYVDSPTKWCRMTWDSTGYFNFTTGVNYRLYCNGEEVTDIIYPSDLTTVSQYKFYRCVSIKSVTFTNNITSISTYAFYGCTGLTSINNYSTLTSIGTYAFYGCSSLQSMHIPNAITTINQYAFHSCSSLSDLILPSAVTTIGNYAFNGCTSLQSIDFPNSLTTIGQYAFNSCSNLEGSFINENCSITTYSFGRCTKMTNITAKSSTMKSVAGAGNNTGTCKLIGNVTLNIHANNDPQPRFVNYIINGNTVGYSNHRLVSSTAYCKSVKISGNVDVGTYGIGYNLTGWEFLEILGTFTSSNTLFPGTCYMKQGGIMHLGYNGIAITIDKFAASSVISTAMGRISKIYVGDGSSQAADQAVLDLYLADTDWSAYSSKLDLWYNYTGEYKTT